ncbi:hypothetical protein [Desulfobacter postgatei]|uniref:hypothetical protein n=1 Tax=Desulfobacter postgatei TaxID=2293 RepID=UPI00259BD457|nr:hypothetical protein [uncultured Desulfobacter sp.]
MKRKLIIAAGMLTLAMVNPSFAWDSSDGNNEQKQSYESSFGNNYQYDLNSPSDRVEYSVDPAAQLRDSIDVNPTRELESGIGENGGGVYGR